MEILYNHHGNYEVKDWAWLNAVFGPGLRYLNAGSGEKFELVKIVVTEAEASLNAHVQNQDGSPCFKQPIGFSWPSLNEPADYLTDLSGGGLKSLWTSRAAIQYTDPNGQTGVGMSTDWYIRDMAKGGPGTIWVLSPSIPADGLTGIGMIGGTEHLAPTHLYFKHTQSGSTPPPNPPPGSGSGDLTETNALLTDLLSVSTALAHHLGVPGY